MDLRIADAWEKVNSIDLIELASLFDDAVKMQSSISKIVGGDIPTKENIAIYSFAMIDEITELAKEIGWKPWKDRPVIDEAQSQKIIEEFADVTAFYFLLANFVMIMTDSSIDDLMGAYYYKSLKNILRLSGETSEPGYNGSGVDRYDDDDHHIHYKE